MLTKHSQQELNALNELAKEAGILTAYKNAWGKMVNASPETLLAVLKSLGFEMDDMSQAPNTLSQYQEKRNKQKINDLTVMWDGKPKTLQVHLNENEALATIEYEILTEGGHSIKKTFKPRKKAAFRRIQLPELPMGYHHLTLRIDSSPHTGLILSAPLKMYHHDTLHHEKTYGLFCPVYALHSKKSMGCGDLGDFKAFSKILAKHQGRLVATMPFFSAFLDKPCEPSPYSPVSRFFWNELFLDLHALGSIPEHHKKALSELNQKKIVDYPATAALKRKIFTELMNERMQDENQKNDFQSYLKASPEVEHYAAFRAFTEQTQTTWTHWQLPKKTGALHASDVPEEALKYHLLAQWQMSKQLKALKSELNARGQFLYLDLPLGSHLEGFDVWAHQDDYLMDAHIGAPPDPMFVQGQNWGIPPLHPEKLKKSHCKPFIQLIQRMVKQVDVLRIDHVMGLNRVYVIPDQCDACDGVYIEYPSEALYAILSIESHRHQVTLIGENLGSIPPETQHMMKRHGMIQMHILEYLLESKEDLLPQSKLTLAGLNTHDMPTFYAYRNGLDIKTYRELNLVTEAYAQEMLKKRQQQLRLLKKTLNEKNLDTQDLLKSSLQLLAESQAELLLINIEDVWEAPEPQNIPTTQDEPNWQRKLAYSLEELETMPLLTQTLDEIQLHRQSDLSQSHSGHISQDDIHLFNEGTHFRLYRHLGAHIGMKDQVEGVHFAVWAPNADAVSVIASFNDWNTQKNPLDRIAHSGIWHAFVPHAKAGDLYKFHIVSEGHHFRADKADPFAFYQETPPHTASIVCDLDYEWHDADWLKKRGQKQTLDAAISIYEVHLGSWRRVEEENNPYLTYREMAPKLTEYVKEMGFTHVEFLPLMEHPFYGSWGYQTLSYFAPSARFGTPQDFMYLIDYLHQHDIAVILDWVPSHFPTDAYGLAEFDGTCLYEHADEKKGFHPDWKSAIFNYGRHEVRSFLISSAVFWMDKYHIDAIRVDAVASMLYLNYSRAEGEWIPNELGGHENFEAIDFIRRLNQTLYDYFPGIQTFAEESTAWPGVTKPIDQGGLGFGYKWDMGWMHDSLQYFSKDPLYRRYHQHQLSFRMVYAFTEHFTLSLSHDEVVHGKGSLLNKMPGDEWSKFANLRVLYGYMFGLPGKKLMFMGNEFGQSQEWSHERSLDWHLLDYPLHQTLKQWVHDLNDLYQSQTALHLDADPAGFEWIDCNDEQNSIFSFLRKSSDNELLLIVLNCTPVTRQFYELGIPTSKTWTLLLNSDDEKYGGAGHVISERVSTKNQPLHNRPCSLSLTLPGLSVTVYQWIA